MAQLHEGCSELDRPLGKRYHPEVNSKLCKECRSMNHITGYSFAVLDCCHEMEVSVACCAHRTFEDSSSISAHSVPVVLSREKDRSINFSQSGDKKFELGKGTYSWRFSFLFEVSCRQFDLFLEKGSIKERFIVTASIAGIMTYLVME